MVAGTYSVLFDGCRPIQAQPPPMRATGGSRVCDVVLVDCIRSSASALGYLGNYGHGFAVPSGNSLARFAGASLFHMLPNVATVMSSGRNALAAASSPWHRDVCTQKNAIIILWLVKWANGRLNSRFNFIRTLVAWATDITVPEGLKFNICSQLLSAVPIFYQPWNRIPAPAFSPPSTHQSPLPVPSHPPFHSCRRALASHFGSLCPPFHHQAATLKKKINPRPISNTCPAFRTTTAEDTILHFRLVNIIPSTSTPHTLRFAVALANTYTSNLRPSANT